MYTVTNYKTKKALVEDVKNGRELLSSSQVLSWARLTVRCPLKGLIIPSHIGGMLGLPLRVE